MTTSPHRKNTKMASINENPCNTERFGIVVNACNKHPNQDDNQKRVDFQIPNKVPSQQEQHHESPQTSFENETNEKVQRDRAATKIQSKVRQFQAQRQLQDKKLENRKKSREFINTNQMDRRAKKQEQEYEIKRKILKEDSAVVVQTYARALSSLQLLLRRKQHQEETISVEEKNITTFIKREIKIFEEKLTKEIENVVVPTPIVVVVETEKQIETSNNKNKKQQLTTDLEKQAVKQEQQQFQQKMLQQQEAKETDAANCIGRTAKSLLARKVLRKLKQEKILFINQELARQAENQEIEHAKLILMEEEQEQEKEQNQQERMFAALMIQSSARKKFLAKMNLENRKKSREFIINIQMDRRTEKQEQECEIKCALLLDALFGKSAHFSEALFEKCALLFEALPEAQIGKCALLEFYKQAVEDFEEAARVEICDHEFDELTAYFVRWKQDLEDMPARKQVWTQRVALILAETARAPPPGSCHPAVTHVNILRRIMEFVTAGSCDPLDSELLLPAFSAIHGRHEMQRFFDLAATHPAWREALLELPTRLSLIGTRLDDSMMHRVAKLARLESLNVSHTKISNAGLIHVATLDALQELDVSYTNIDDAGLMQLVNLPSLNREKIRTGGSQVTAAGLDEFKKTLVNNQALNAAASLLRAIAI